LFSKVTYAIYAPKQFKRHQYFFEAEYGEKSVVLNERVGVTRR
jgi:hypothetical protein